MKTITKKYQVFSVKELSKQARETAHKVWRANNEYTMLEECMLDNLAEQLKEYKIKSDDFKVGYSLGYCQGDGAMFYGKFDWGVWRVEIKHEGRYYHSNSKGITIVQEKDDKWASEKTYERFEKIYQKICKELERYGYDFIETEDSMENFIEECEANDYQFLVSGASFNE